MFPNWFISIHARKAAAGPSNKEGSLEAADYDGRKMRTTGRAGQGRAEMEFVWRLGGIGHEIAWLDGPNSTLHLSRMQRICFHTGLCKNDTFETLKIAYIQQLNERFIFLHLGLDDS